MVNNDNNILGEQSPREWMHPSCWAASRAGHTFHLHLIVSAGQILKIKEKITFLTLFYIVKGPVDTP